MRPVPAIVFADFAIAFLMVTILASLAGAGPASGPAAGQHPWAATDLAGTTMKTVIYKKTPQGELEMFLHFPKDWKAADQRPAIVFFFGGAWTGGTPLQFERQAVYFATRGMVAARADYRVATRHGTAPDAAVEDAKSAVRYLRAHAAPLGIDPARIVASGGSAGGHLAICSAVTPGLEAPGEDVKASSAPNALVLFNPVLATHEGAVIKRVPLARQLSPVLHITDKTPPMIVFFGEKDRFYQNGGRDAQALCAKLRLNAQWKIYPGLNHGFFNSSPHYESTVRQADEFLTSLGYLKGAPTMSPAAIQLTSPAFSHGQPIPKKHTGEGADLSPALAWTGSPAAAKSFALLVDDPDAPVGDWVHWLLYNIPGPTTSLPEGIAAKDTAAGTQGKNSWNTIGYRGPMPPPGKPHRYFFKLYALDADLSLPAGLTKKEFLQKITGHVLAEGQLMGTYRRHPSGDK